MLELVEKKFSKTHKKIFSCRLTLIVALKLPFRKKQLPEATVGSINNGEHVTSHPPLPECYIEVERYCVEKPFAEVRIFYSGDEYFYVVEEPALSRLERALLERIDEDLRDVLITEDIEGDKEDALREKVKEFLRSYKVPLGDAAFQRIFYYIKRDYLGFGKINALMRDPNIEDISCNGAGIPVFIYHRKYENVKTNTVFDEEELDVFVMRLAQRGGRHLSFGKPMVQATLPGGSRLQATLGREISPRGSSFVIRKFREIPFTPVDLMRFKTFSADMLAYLWLAIENRRSMLVCGGTASGKTSTLNALSLFIPSNSKIVTIEDTRELTLYHENWIAGLTRESAAADGRGEITMFDLLKAALRQRPECIIVGEIRGEEALTLFQAMSTGHTAYSTMHAGDVQEAVSRLENEPINVPGVMLQALDVMLVQGFAIIEGRRVRRCKSIVEFVGLDPRTNNIRINETYRWVPAKDEFEQVAPSKVLEGIAEERGWSPLELNKELLNRKKILEYMLREDISDYRGIAKLVRAYHTNPEEVLSRVEAKA